jgi:hypothetical protein
MSALGRRGQAVAGTGACLDALMKAQVDVLVMAKGIPAPARLGMQCLRRGRY